MDQVVEFAQATRHACWEQRRIVEGPGAVGIAALMSGPVRPDGPVAVPPTACSRDTRPYHRKVSGEDVDVIAEREPG